MRDNHHILHSRQEWELRPQARALRENKTLIPNLDRSTHNELHRMCPPVPILGYHALNKVLSEFYPARDTLQSMDNLLFAIELAANMPQAHRIEREMAHLAIQAIELQKPFVRHDQFQNSHLRLVQ